MPHAVRHADPLQRFHHPLLAFRRRHLLPVGQWQLDVFVDGEIANQIETLEDEPDLLVANARALREVEVLHRSVYSAGSFPPVGVSSRPMIESSVDLPQPEGPDMATYSPLRMAR